ncbi:MAG: hypothetical protein RIS09_1344 [Actinomycetota bacterium]
MILLRNINIVKNTRSDRIDIARQLNLTLNTASSLGLVFDSREEIQEFTLAISSYTVLDEYVLAGSYLIDDQDLGNPLTLKNRKDVDYQAQVLIPNFLQLFNQKRSLVSVMKFLLKQRGGTWPSDVSDVLSFLNLDSTALTAEVERISILDSLKAQMVIATLIQTRFVILEELDAYLDDAELYEFVDILQRYQITSGASCLYATTDFNWAIENTDSVGIMRAGLLMESGSAVEIEKKPLHPLTLALLASKFPKTMSPTGCPFVGDCAAKSRVSENLCSTTLPVAVSITDTHSLRCHLSASERTAYVNEVMHGNS